MAPIGHFKDTRFALLWGNVGVPSTAGTEVTKVFAKTTALTALPSFELPVEKYTMFSLNQNKRRPNRQTSHRHRTFRDTWNDMVGAIPGVTISLPATQELVDLFLYMAFQRVTEGTTPFVKSFEYPNSAETSLANGRYPEFNNDEGAFCGFVIDHGIGHLNGECEMLMGCVPTQVTISCSADQHDGKMWIDATFIARYYEASVAYAGAITNCAQEDTGVLHINDLDVCTLLGSGAGAVPLNGFSFTIDTGLKFVPFGGVGAGSKDCIMSGPHSSGWVDFMVDDSSVQVLVNAQLNIQTQVTATTNTIAWGDGTTSTDGEFTINWVPQVNDISAVGDEEKRFKIEFECIDSETGHASTSTNSDALVISMCNAIDRGW